jgi:Ca2+-binding RTX toxin-like protein
VTAAASLVLGAGVLAACHTGPPGGVVSVQLGEARYVQTVSGTASHAWIRFSEATQRIHFHDSAGLEAGEGCQQADAHTVTCPGDVDGIVMDMGDGNDFVVNETPNFRSDIIGGPGNDTLTGGPLDDDLTGSAGNDTLNGGGGNDKLRELSSEIDADTYSGGAGDSDQILYDASEVGVTTLTVTLDGLPNDGFVGELDNVMSDIENVSGTNNIDVISGSDVPNRVETVAGNDVLNGLGGDDTLDAGAGFDIADGGAGNDVCIDVELPTNCEA